MFGLKAFVVVVGVALGLGAASAQSSESFTFSGDVNGNAISGQLNLNVTNGQVTSASGLLSIPTFALLNASLALITPATPGNDTGSGYPVSFRDNGGTDIFGDTSFPLTDAGLVFNVGTTVPQRSAYPIFNIGANADGSFYALFTSAEHYVQIGSLTLTPSAAMATPGPLAGAGLIPLLGLAGTVAWRRREKLAA